MKRLVLVLVLLAVAASSSPAQLSFGGGAHTNLAFTSFPRPANEFYGLGYGGGVHADLNILPFLSTRLSADYSTFSSDKAKLKGLFTVRDRNGNLTNNFTVEGMNVAVIGVMANVLGKIPTGSAFRPYGLVGFGLQILSNSDLNVVVDGETIPVEKAAATTTNFGLNFGAGVDFALGHRTSLFLESKYTLMFTSGESSSYIPVTVGVSF